MMKLYCFVWICLLYYLIRSCQEIVGLKCLQCNSQQDKLCYSGQSEAVECLDTHHKYCITYSGVLRKSGIHVLFRDCSVENVTGDCQIVTVSGKGNETKPIKFRVCYRSCDTDGCNREIHDLSSSSSASWTLAGSKNVFVEVATSITALFHCFLLECLFPK